MLKVEKFKTSGNHDLMLCEIGPDNRYKEDVFGLQGLIECSVEYSQEANIIAADDDPLAFAEYGPVSGSGELKMTGIHVDALKKFFGVETNEHGGVSIGGYVAEPKFFGMALKSRGSDKSLDYYCMQRVLFNIPALKLTTKTIEGKETNECTIPFNCYPYFYIDKTGHEQRTTANYFNSAVNVDIWSKIENTVYDPTADYNTPEQTGPTEIGA